MRCLLAVLLAFAPTIAHADVARDLKAMIEDLPQRDPDKDNPRFMFTDDKVWWAGQRPSSVQPNFMASVVAVTKQVTGTSSDGAAAWVAAEAKGVPQDDDCTPGPCGPNKEPPYHVTGLLEKGPKGWAWVAWHSAPPVPGKEEAELKKEGVAVDPITKSTTGAEDVVTLFEASIADPKAFAATVSDRKEVVLYGSESAERTVGGAAVKKRLVGWNLKLSVRDGIHAGVTANKALAYVAANIEATSLKKPNDKPSPYRLLAIYEKTTAGWKLVVAHFSVDKFTYVKSK
jgi:hypothetical protein